MDKFSVGVLTVSDRCSKNDATDESGPCLMNMINNGIFKNGVVTKSALVPDCEGEIIKVLREWCDESINLILTTGGTGISKTDVTPEATAKIVEKTIPGISGLLFKRSLEVTPFAALSRGIAGVRGKTLIINFPGSKKAAMECLEAVACIVPHAVDLITDRKKTVEQVHEQLRTKKSSVITNNPAARRRFSKYTCITVSEAQKIVTERVFMLTRENIKSLDEARSYVLAQDVIARDNLPPFDTSLKDGYAVCCVNNLHPLKVIGVSKAGNPLPDVRVQNGLCVRISTGAAIPVGAEAVVEVENTTVYTLSKDNKEENEIRVTTSTFSRGLNIRPSGSDFKMGEVLLKFKSYLDPAAIGLLAAAGVTSVRVFDKPLVGIISTGDEIVHPGETLSPGKVRDSNRITLLNLLEEENFKALDLGIVPDEPEELRDSLERGFRMADIIVTTGSLSMGERDYMKEILEVDFNAEICFGRVLMKPGKPTSFAVVLFEGRPKLWFGLPGNPASAFVTAQLFILPALRSISGQQEVFPMSVRATVNKFIVLEDRPHYVRGVMTYEEKTNSWCASIKENQSSSSIRNCVNTNCLLEFPSISENKGVTSLQKHSNQDKMNLASDDVKEVKAFLTGKSFFRA